MMSLSLKDSLFLGFCAVMMLIARVALRLHLHISGHVMLLTVFFLMVARGCVSHKLAATFTGFLAGLAAILLGLGKSGPLILLKFVLPAIAIDAGALLCPALFESYLFCGLVGLIASSTKFIDTFVIDILTGMDRTVAFQHALFEAGTAIAFGVVGSLFVPMVIRKLKSHGVIE